MITIYYANKDLNLNFGGTTYTPPATWYLGLSLTDPGYSGSAVSEPTDPSYARVAVTNNHSNFSVSTAGSLVINVDVVFPESSVPQGTITDLLFWNASSGSNLCYYQPLPSPRSVSGSSIMRFLANSITVSQAP